VQAFRDLAVTHERVMKRASRVWKPDWNFQQYGMEQGNQVKRDSKLARALNGDKEA